MRLCANPRAGHCSEGPLRMPPARKLLKQCARCISPVLATATLQMNGRRTGQVCFKPAQSLSALACLFAS